MASACREILTEEQATAQALEEIMTGVTRLTAVPVQAGAKVIYA